MGCQRLRVRVPLPRMQNRNLIESFKAAFSGIFYAFKHHRNFRILIFIAFLVTLTATFFDFTLERWSILILLIGVILTAELLNTAIEVLADYVSQKNYQEDIKIIKDISAGAVLLISIFLIILSIFLFLL